MSKNLETENKKLENSIKYGNKYKEESENLRITLENQLLESKKIQTEFLGKNVRLEKEMKAIEFKF